MKNGVLMISFGKLTGSFVHLLVLSLISLSPRGAYGQVISFEEGLVQEKKSKISHNSYQEEGFSSTLIGSSDYKGIRDKLQHLKLKLTKEKKSNAESKLGDEKEFFVRDIITGNTWNTSLAILGYKSSSVNIWVQKSAFDTLSGTPMYQEMLEGFEQLFYHSTPQYSVAKSKGVLDILNQYVGEFPDVDGDQVLDVLLLDIQDNFDETGSFVAGFFDPVNLYEFEFSNEIDLIYLDLYPTIIFNETINVERAVSTFAHESQHLIHAGYEGDEAELVFINEGFSEEVEILCGFEPRSEEGYQQVPLRGLLDWNFENPIPDYSRASLWTQYLIEQLGEGALKKLVQNSRIGFRGYEEIIESSSAYSFEEIFRNWGLALLINDQSVQKEFGYTHPLRREPILLTSLSVTDLPTAFNGSMPSLAHISINFLLTKELNLRIGEPSSKNSWISTVSTYPESNENQVDISRGPLITSTAEQFKYGNIETLISFVGEPELIENKELSFYAEGVKSGRLLEREYGDGNPDKFYQNASYLSLNNINQKMGVVFAPTLTSYWLKDLAIRTLFKSELEGSGIDGDEGRDFEIDVFTFKNGKPDHQLIPTTKLIVARELGKLVEEVFPLSHFYDQLSSLGDSIIVIIGNDEDDENFIALGMDKGSQNASFFSEIGSTDASWVSLSEKSIGGNSFSNWNPVIQINTVLPEVREESSSTIQNIEYNFREVLVKVLPDKDYDTTSVNLVAKLPDRSFREGKLSSKESNEYIFTLPVLVNGSYTFISSYKSVDAEITYTDQKEWSIEIPDGFELNSNYPNPFNPSTTIPFILLEEARIAWQVYDVLGRVIMEIPEQRFSSGEYTQDFNMNGFASGMYIVRAKLDRERDGTTTFRTQKIMLLK